MSSVQCVCVPSDQTAPLDYCLPPMVIEISSGPSSVQGRGSFVDLSSHDYHRCQGLCLSGLRPSGLRLSGLRLSGLRPSGLRLSGLRLLCLRLLCLESSSDGSALPVRVS